MLIYDVDMQLRDDLFCGCGNKLWSTTKLFIGYSICIWCGVSGHYPARFLPENLHIKDTMDPEIRIALLMIEYKTCDDEKQKKIMSIILGNSYANI